MSEQNHPLLGKLCLQSYIILLCHISYSRDGVDRLGLILRIFKHVISYHIVNVHLIFNYTVLTYSPLATRCINPPM